MSEIEDDLKSDSPDDSSGENLGSLYRPVEGIAANIKHRALAFLSFGSSVVEAFALPVAPALDAVDSSRNNIRNLVEKAQNADHESAHLLLSILNNFPLFRMWASKYGNNVTMALGLPKGFVATEYFDSMASHSAVVSDFRDFVDPTVLDASKLSDAQIIKHIFILLAGYPVNVNSEGGDNDKVRKMMSKKFALPVFGTHDVALVKKILASTKYKDVMKGVFDLLTEKIIKFMNDLLVRKVIDIFSSELLEKHDIHAEGKEIAPMMVDLLERKGVSQADFEKMRQRYDEMVKETMAEMKEFLQ